MEDARNSVAAASTTCVSLPAGECFTEETSVEKVAVALSMAFGSGLKSGVVVSLTTFVWCYSCRQGFSVLHITPFAYYEMLVSVCRSGSAYAETAAFLSGGGSVVLSRVGQRGISVGTGVDFGEGAQLDKVGAFALQCGFPAVASSSLGSFRCALCFGKAFESTMQAVTPVVIPDD